MKFIDTLYPLFLIPLIGFFIILIIPFNTKDNKILGKQIALITSIITFAESLRLWMKWDYTTSEFQFIISLPSFIYNQAIYESTIFNNQILFGIDGISLFYVILTTLLIPVCLLASWDSIKILDKTYLLCFIGLEILLIGVFTILDILGFYVLFEGVLIPMFLIIGIWGSRKEKITAAYYFFFYTLIGSVLMLIGILYIYNITGTTDYLSLLGYEFDETVQKWLFLSFFASLAVKIPKFPFHIWLPQAHVEAPVGGSVILAGVLIKLGGYGLIRYTLPLLPAGVTYFTPLVITLGVLAIIYASLTTLRQTDLKRIIAYSSVSHMGVVTLGIMSCSIIGIEGSIFLQLAHGLVSSALFIIVTILYDRHHTRLVKYYRGITITMPLYSSLFLFFTLANIGAPLTCNFIGEFICLLATFELNTWIGLLASLGMILSACYGLFLYNRVAFGSMSLYLKSSYNVNRDINRREFYVLLPLVVLTILLGIAPNFIFDTMHSSVTNLVTFMN